MRLSSSEQRLPRGQPYSRGQLALGGELADERLQPRLGAAVALERLEQRPHLVRVALDRGVHEIVLGLEVVVDVADGHVSGSGDVGDRRLLDPLLVDHLARAGHEPLRVCPALASAIESVISPRG